MQFIILAAGRGRRINEITSKIPKCLIEINNGTILSRLINQSKILSIKKVNIILGYKNKIIQNYIKKNKFKNIKTYTLNSFKNYNNFFTLYKFRRLLKNKNSFILFSDLVLDDSIFRKFKKIRTKQICLFVDKREIRKGTMSISSDPKYLKFINIKKKEDQNNGNFIGVAYIPKGKSNLFIKTIEKNYPQLNHDYYTEILNELISQKEKIKIFNILNYWTEIDTLSDLNELRKNFSEKK